MVSINDFDLLSFEPIKFHGLLIHKHTLAEISKLGRDNFNSLTNLLCIDEKQLKKQLKDLCKKELGVISEEDMETLYHPYNFLVRQGGASGLDGNILFLKLQLAFATYIQREITISNGNIVVLSKDEKEKEFVFSKETFEDFQQIIRLINCYDELEEKEPEIVTDNLEMKKKFEEKRKMLKAAKEKEREKQKESGNGKTMTLAQVISYICAFPSSYNLINVWDLTIYQLHNQFNILQLKEDYDSKITIMSSGMADSKKLDVKYWMKTE